MQFRQLILAASALVMARARPALGQGSAAPVAGSRVGDAAADRARGNRGLEGGG
jgi:hypothetical protein